MRRFAACLCLLAWLGTVLGCAGSHQRQKASDDAAAYEYVIGISQANLVEPWRIAVYDEFQRASKGYPNTRLIFTDAVGDSARQSEDVSRLLDLGIDLLIISPNDSVELSESIAAVYARIPVIVLDRDVVGQPYTLFIGPDNEKIGRMAGERVVALLREEGGQVLELAGSEDSPPTDELSRGFQSVIAAHREIETQGTIYADWLKDTAAGEMKNFLINKAYFVEADPFTLVVFAHNDAMALGASETVEKSFPKSSMPDIHYIGVDGLPNFGARFVAEGRFDATFSRPTAAKETLDYAYRILGGEVLSEKRHLLEPKAILGD